MDCTNNTMIRLFLHICKTFHKIKNLDEHTIYSCIEHSCFSLAQDSPSCPCPSCHAPSSAYRRNGSYRRHLVGYAGGCVRDSRICVHSCLCTSCRHSHALLPSTLIPYTSYSLIFLISLIYARITEKFSSVFSLCQHFDISESTYYRIWKRFVLDSKNLRDAICTLTQVLEQVTPPAFITLLSSMDPVMLHKSLALFFLSTGRSFLQHSIRLRPKLPLQALPAGYHQIT